MTKKTALITGISGQDGAYLAEFLLKKKYRIIGIERRSARSNNWRLEKLNIKNKVTIVDLDIKEVNNLIRLFDKYKIDEVYNLAAQSFVHSSFQNPIETSLVNSIGVLNLLEIIRNKKNKIKFYQASTSEMFGESRKNSQNEKTLFHPRSPYATSKIFAHFSVQNYREAYKLHAVNGILFNHESPLRGEEFITRKITLGLSKIIFNKQKELKIGNLYAKRDWGYAKDYVEAMWLMLQKDKPDDYVIATGETNSVRDFAQVAAKSIDIDIEWDSEGDSEIGICKKTGSTIISIDKQYTRPSETDHLLGDASKAKENLGWKPSINFQSLVIMMVEHDLKRIEDNNF